MVSPSTFPGTIEPSVPGHVMAWPPPGSVGDAPRTSTPSLLDPPNERAKINAPATAAPPSAMLPNRRFSSEAAGSGASRGTTTASPDAPPLATPDPAAGPPAAEAAPSSAPAVTSTAAAAPATAPATGKITTAAAFWSSSVGSPVSPSEAAAPTPAATPAAAATPGARGRSRRPRRCSSLTVGRSGSPLERVSISRRVAGSFRTRSIQSGRRNVSVIGVGFTPATRSTAAARSRATLPGSTRASPPIGTTAPGHTSTTFAEGRASWTRPTAFTPMPSSSTTTSGRWTVRARDRSAMLSALPATSNPSPESRKPSWPSRQGSSWEPVSPTTTRTSLRAIDLPRPPCALPRTREAYRTSPEPATSLVERYEPESRSHFLRPWVT